MLPNNVNSPWEPYSCALKPMLAALGQGDEEVGIAAMARSMDEMTHAGADVENHDLLSSPTAQRISLALPGFSDELTAHLMSASQEESLAIQKQVLERVKGILALVAKGEDAQAKWEVAPREDRIEMVIAVFRRFRSILPPEQLVADFRTEDCLQDMRARLAERHEQLELAAENLGTIREQAEAAAREACRRVGSKVFAAVADLAAARPAAEKGAPGGLRSGADGLYVPVESTRHVWASAWIEAPSLRAAEPVDLVLCIDNSGSMSGSMPGLRSMLCRLLDCLRPEDRICAMTFNHEARLLAEWTCTTDAGKEELRAIFSGLSAGGGTKFSPALTLALSQAEAAAKLAGRTMRVVLLSDGATQEPSSTVLGLLTRQLAPVGIALCTVGFGHGSDAKLMRQLSQLGRGPFIFAASEVDTAAALGRLQGWAEESPSEGFLLARGVGGCRIVEVEGALGSARIEDEGAVVLTLGPLLGGKPRSVAMRLELPPDMPVPAQDLNAPLVDCTFVVRGSTGPQASVCNLRVLHIPSLLLEGLTGIPVRVNLHEEFQKFGEDRQLRLRSVLGDYWHLPHAAIVIDRVRAGSVLVDLRVAVPDRVAEGLISAFDAQAVENELRGRGFAVDYVIIPGRRTARRVLQWGAADKLQGLTSPGGAAAATCEAGARLEALAASGALKDLDPTTARGVLADIQEARSAWESEEADARHRRLQLQAAHAMAFGADPDSHASLRAYETPAQRAAALALAGAGYSSGQRSRKGKLELSAVRGLSLARAEFESLDIEFRGVGSERGGVPVSHSVSAVEVRLGADGGDGDSGQSGVRTWEVSGAEGTVELQLAGLAAGRAYLVSVGTGAAGYEGGSLPCTPRLMSTLSPWLRWSKISLSGPADAQTLHLVWSGRLNGEKWTVSLATESVFKGRRDAGIFVTKSVVTANSHWDVPIMSSGVYRIIVEDAPVGGGRKPEVRGRCWVAVGDPLDSEAARRRLQERYGGTAIVSFSSRALAQDEGGLASGA